MQDVPSEPASPAAQEEAPLARVAAPVEPPVLVRSSPDAWRLDGWALVLSSRGIASHVRPFGSQLELWVAPADAGLALAELAAVDAEEQHARPRTREPAGSPRITRHAALGGVLVAALLLAFFAVTGGRASGSSWFAAGASDAGRVLEGEWWRAVTALTLHADTAHVVSNVGIGTLVVGAVMHSEGVGLGASLVLASGTLGNIMNAWAHRTMHSSVGFSTAVFGAIGLLGGLAFVRRETSASRRATWTALGGTFALLALLGSGERSDIFAHLFGALAGVGLGLLVGSLGIRLKGTLAQSVLGLAATSVVVGSWLIARA